MHLHYGVIERGSIANNSSGILPYAECEINICVLRLTDCTKLIVYYDGTLRSGVETSLLS